MAGTSISSLILFIAAMLVAAAVAGTLVGSVTDISNSIDVHSSEVADDIDTDIEIISDAGSDAVYDGGDEITLLVKNTGTSTLSEDPDAHDVLVNGQYITGWPEEAIEIKNDDVWRSGVVAEFTIDLTEDDAIDADDLDGENRIVVDVGGDREVFEFYHG